MLSSEFVSSLHVTEMRRRRRELCAIAFCYDFGVRKRKAKR
jgi:hypothetical protein